MCCVPNSERRRVQHGLSLVELLVALALGSFLLLGITQLLLQGQRQYLLQLAQLESQENARLASLTTERLLARAGYRGQVQDGDVAQAFPALEARAGCPSFAAGQSIALALAGNRRQAVLCVRYQRGLEAEEADCSGTPLVFAERPQNYLTRLTFDSDSRTLACAAWREDLANVANDSVLVGGLLDFRFATLPARDDPVQAVALDLLSGSEQRVPNEGGRAVLERWRTLTGRSPERLEDENRLLHISRLDLALRNLGP